MTSPHCEQTNGQTSNVVSPHQGKYSQKSAVYEIAYSQKKSVGSFSSFYRDERSRYAPPAAHKHLKGALAHKGKLEQEGEEVHLLNANAREPLYGALISERSVTASFLPE